MRLSILVIAIIHFKCVQNRDSDCGCHIDRDNKDLAKQESIFGSLSDNDRCHLPLNDDIDNIEKRDVAGEMVLIPGGIYQLGTNDILIESDKEGPKQLVKLKSFYLDKYEVSNRDFSTFTELTNYKTEAETFGDSFVFTLFLNSTFKEQLKDYRVAQAPWWYKVFSASWKHPNGPDSDILDVMDHPVTHVSWNDARAYCAWKGLRLPTEVEWEAACRGGHRDTKYPWGDKLFPNRKHMANIWQGTFPNYNTAKDGYIGTNPVHMFSQNDYGLHNMAGNVWEWTDSIWTQDNKQEKVKKGGSYLCHHSYCYRYRCSARSHNTDDSSAGNLGFRCAKSAPKV